MSGPPNSIFMQGDNDGHHVPNADLMMSRGGTVNRPGATQTPGGNYGQAQPDGACRESAITKWTTQKKMLMVIAFAAIASGCGAKTQADEYRHLDEKAALPSPHPPAADGTALDPAGADVRILEMQSPVGAD